MWDGGSTCIRSNRPSSMLPQRPGRHRRRCHPDGRKSDAADAIRPDRDPHRRCHHRHGGLIVLSRLDLKLMRLAVGGADDSPTCRSPTRRDACRPRAIIPVLNGSLGRGNGQNASVEVGGLSRHRVCGRRGFLGDHLEARERAWANMKSRSRHRWHHVRAPSRCGRCAACYGGIDVYQRRRVGPRTALNPSDRGRADTDVAR